MTPSTYQIEYVKVSKKRVSIEYTRQKKEGADEFSLQCSDIPLPSFYAALAELKVDVIDICGLPDHFGKDMEVRGVRFTHHKGRLGAVISGTKKLTTSNAPFNINTPFLDDNDSEGPTLSAEQIRRLIKVSDEANKYIGGDRAQGTLQFKDKKEEKGSTKVGPRGIQTE